MPSLVLVVPDPTALPSRMTSGTCSPAYILIYRVVYCICCSLLVVRSPRYRFTRRGGGVVVASRAYLTLPYPYLTTLLRLSRRRRTRRRSSSSTRSTRSPPSATRPTERWKGASCPRCSPSWTASSPAHRYAIRHAVRVGLFLCLPPLLLSRVVSPLGYSVCRAPFGFNPPVYFRRPSCCPQSILNISTAHSPMHVGGLTR